MKVPALVSFLVILRVSLEREKERERRGERLVDMKAR